MRTADPHGGIDISPVNEFALVPEVEEAEPGPGLSSVAAVCRRGGFADLMGADGRTFRNTGACVSYVASRGVLFPRG
ncbi:hypothetical protein [Microbacterium sp. G2-8]|uniref:hypothetical protein n=1 Tax=Microbacterium sp. G2-8 TaxID=2842454 RepID=UPI001C8AE6D6|nr:hypothetical protein [Microbacterium sp. G2-8]